MTTKPDYLPVGTKVTLHTDDSFNGMQGEIIDVDYNDNPLLTLCYHVGLKSTDFNGVEGITIWFRRPEVQEIPS